MGPTQINGLPAHVLLVHVVVVVIPLAALALVLSVTWPAAQRRLGVVTPLLALVGLVFVPVTTHAGEWLAARLGTSPAIAHHVQIGHDLLPWAVVLFVVALAHWLWARATRRAAVTVADRPSGGGVAVAERTTTATPTRVKVGNAVFVVVGVAAAVVAVWMTYRIGDSGAKAAWTGIVR